MLSLKEKEYSKKCSVLLSEKIMIDLEAITIKYGLSESAAIRFLMVEGILSLKEQGRLHSIDSRLITIP